MVKSALWSADDDKFSPYLLDVGNATHVILEAEWKRVKAGEPSYLRTLFWTKVLVAVLGITLAAGTIVVALQKLSPRLVELFKG